MQPPLPARAGVSYVSGSHAMDRAYGQMHRRASESAATSYLMFPASVMKALPGTSLRSLSWCSTMILSHLYALEQLRLQEKSSDPEGQGAPFHEKRRLCTSHSGSDGMTHSTNEDEHVRQVPPLIVLRLTHDEIDSAGGNGAECTPTTPRAAMSPEEAYHILLQLFEENYFPSALFASHEPSSSASVAPVCKERFPADDGSRDARPAPREVAAAERTESDIRGAFRLFLSAGHRCVAEALSRAAAPGDATPTTKSGADLLAAVQAAASLPRNAASGCASSANTIPSDAVAGDRAVAWKAVSAMTSPFPEVRGGARLDEVASVGRDGVYMGDCVTTGEHHRYSSECNAYSSEENTGVGFETYHEGHRGNRREHPLAGLPGKASTAASESAFPWGGIRLPVGSSETRSFPDGPAGVQQAMEALQFLFVLAYSCPFAPLSQAAQLLLASGLAVERPLNRAGYLCVLQYLPSLNLELLGCPASDAWPIPQPEVDRVDPPASGAERAPVGEMAGDGEAPAPRPSVEEEEEEEGGSPPPPSRSHRRILCFGAPVGPHVQSAEEWAVQQAGPSGRGAQFVVIGPLPATMVLPVTQRLLIDESGQPLAEDVEHIVQAVHRSARRAVAGEEAAGWKLPGPAAVVGQAFLSRRRRPGAVAGRKPPPTGGKPSEEEGLHTGESTSSSRMPRARRRTRAVLLALSRSHLFVPPPLRRTAKEVMYTVFSETGECPRYYALLSLYPEVLRTHHASLRYVLFGDGPLSVDVRLMLAVMAASRHKCEYLVSRFAALLMCYSSLSTGMCGDGSEGGAAMGRAGSTSFGPGVEESGEPTSDTPEHWLHWGPSGRLRDIRHFIALAAHTPWLLTEENVREALLAGWTVPELFQVTAIIAHVVPLCSFVMGMFIPTDPWTASALPTDISGRLEHRAMGDAGAASREGSPSMAHVFTRFAGADSVVSEQRIRGSTGSSQHTLWRSVFSWHEMGGALMEQYYPGAAALLNEELDSFADVVRQLTEADCVGLKSPEFTPANAFHSLQVYVLNLLGFMVEDYPYNDINKVLRRSAKWFAQVLIMRPEALTRDQVLQWYASAGTTKDPAAPRSSAEASLGGTATLAAHRRQKEDELLAMREPHVASGGRTSSPRWSPSSALPSSGTSPSAENAPPTPKSPEEEEEVEALGLLHALQDERVLLLTALATMEARKEGLLHIMLHSIFSALNNM